MFMMSSEHATVTCCEQVGVSDALYCQLKCQLLDANNVLICFCSFCVHMIFMLSQILKDGFRLSPWKSSTVSLKTAVMWNLLFI